MNKPRFEPVSVPRLTVEEAVAVRRDPATRFQLQVWIDQASFLDPVDAERDAELLLAVARAKRRAILPDLPASITKAGIVGVVMVIAVALSMTGSTIDAAKTPTGGVCPYGYARMSPHGIRRCLTVQQAQGIAEDCYVRDICGETPQEHGAHGTGPHVCRLED